MAVDSAMLAEADGTYGITGEAAAYPTFELDPIGKL